MRGDAIKNIEAVKYIAGRRTSDHRFVTYGYGTAADEAALAAFENPENKDVDVDVCRVIRYRQALEGDYSDAFESLVRVGGLRAWFLFKFEPCYTYERVLAARMKYDTALFLPRMEQ